MYEIIPKAPRITNSTKKPKPGPHADGVVGSVNSPTVESLVKQLHDFSVKQYVVEATKAATPSSQTTIVFAQSSSKGNQQPSGKKKKEKKGEVIKTSRNPQIMLMGVRNIKRR